MVKDHSDSEKGNPLPPHRLVFPINSKGFFYMHHPTNRIAHTTVFVYTSRGALAGTRNSSMSPPELVGRGKAQQWPNGVLAPPDKRSVRERSPLVPPPPPPPLLYFNGYIVLDITVEVLSRTKEPAKAGTCARDRRALQQLALNVHVKHSDLT